MLTPPAEEGVAQVAKALEQRPQVGIQVHGGYDLTRDPEALRLRAARDELARAAGVKGALDLSDPKVVRAAERLYLKRVGDRAALAALRKGERATAGRCCRGSPPPCRPMQAAVQALARSARRQCERRLLDHGVDPARVRDRGRRGGSAGRQSEGVPTELCRCTEHRPLTMTARAASERSSSMSAKAPFGFAAFAGIPAEKCVSLWTGSGSGPTISIPGTGASSQSCCTPSSASPAATTSPTGPFSTTTRFFRVMFRRCSSSAK